MWDLQRHCRRVNLHIYNFATAVPRNIFGSMHTMYLRSTYLALQWNDFEAGSSWLFVIHNSLSVWLKFHFA